MPPDPHAAIIIPHLNDASRLGECLRALFDGAEGDDLHGIEVVVVDNGSTQVPWDVIARFPGVRLIVEPQPGAAHARNAGVRATSAPMLWFLDCDCRPAQGWAHRAMRHRDPDVIVAGDVRITDATQGSDSSAAAFERLFAFRIRTYVAKGFGVTANLLVPRPLFERTGPFRHGLPEDKDWCHRALTAGGRIVFDPALIVHHPPRADWAALRAKWKRLVREDRAAHQAAGKSRAAWGVRAAMVAASGIVDSVRVLISPQATRRFGVIATLVRLRMLRAIWMIRDAP